MDIDDFLELDNQEVCYNSFYKGFHVWQANRVRIINDLIAKQEGLTYAKNIVPRKFFKLLKYVVLSFIYRPKRGKKYDVLFFAPSGTNSGKNERGEYTQRICGPFSKLLTDRAKIIGHARKFTFLRPVDTPVWYSDWYIIESKLYTLFFSVFHYTDYKNLVNIVNGIKEEVRKKNSTVCMESFEKEVFKQFVFFTLLKKKYVKMLRRIEPKIIFVNCFSYGGEQALMAACRELHIVCAELQHGYVERNHPAYNYGSKYFDDNGLRNLLPDYFLTMGAFWADRIRTPSNKIVIGPAYLAPYTRIQKEKIILVLSYTNNPQIFSQLIEDISPFALQNRYKIILKLHPYEFSEVDTRFKRIKNLSCVEIKTSENVYELLGKASIVVASVTTVAYEALYFGIKPFVIYDSYTKDRMDFSFFESFTNATELIEKINQSNLNSEVHFEYVWEKNYKTNFISFLRNTVNIEI